jgi:hypothetical protein
MFLDLNPIGLVGNFKLIVKRATPGNSSMNKSAIPSWKLVKRAFLHCRLQLF